MYLNLYGIFFGSGEATSGSLVLEYAGSGLDSGSLVNVSGSYNGSIKDPYYQYGTWSI